MEKFVLNLSPARRHFKKRIGQANHFLITTLVGLDGVKSGNVSISNDFRASWNPRNYERSAERSARFIIDASLSWVVDNLDSYFVESFRKPSIIESEELKENYTKADRSVNKRFELFYMEARKGGQEIDRYAALVALAIQWRNNIVHFGARNEIDPRYDKILRENKKFYMDEFRHLDIDVMLGVFKSEEGHPSFKEVTSMIHAIHKFVESVDCFLLDQLDIERYKADLFDKHCSEYKKIKKKLETYSKKRKQSFYKTLYRQYGFGLEEGTVK